MKKRRLVFGFLVGVLCLAGLSLLGNACEGPRSTGMGFSSIVINAPPEQVWAYMDDVDNWKDFNPEINMKNLEGHGLGATWEYEDEVAGLKINGRTVWIEYVPNQRAVAMTTNNLYDMLETWVLAPCPEGTKLILAVQLSGALPPGISMDKAREMFLETGNTALRRIKEAVEK